MRRWCLLVLLVLHPAWSRADCVADPAEPLQVEAAATLARFRESGPALAAYFDQAYACAVFPKIIRAGLGVGGSYGRGLVLAAGGLQGEVTQAGVTLGLQAGGQAHSQIIFFRSPEALELFLAKGNLGPVSGRLELAGRVSAVAARSGGATDPGFSSDVAIFSLTRGGLMLELAAGPVRYHFAPLQGAAPREH